MLTFIFHLHINNNVALWKLARLSHGVISFQGNGYKIGNSIPLEYRFLQSSRRLYTAHIDTVENVAAVWTVYWLQTDRKVLALGISLLSYKILLVVVCLAKSYNFFWIFQLVENTSKRVCYFAHQTYSSFFGPCWYFLLISSLV